MHLIHIRIHCNIVNNKAHLKHCAFYSLKGINTLVNEYIMLNSSINRYCMKKFKKNMPSYLAVTSNGLFSFKPFEKRQFEEKICFSKLF